MGKGTKQSSYSAEKVLFCDLRGEYVDIFTLGKILMYIKYVLSYMSDKL